MSVASFASTAQLYPMKSVLAALSVALIISNFVLMYGQNEQRGMNSPHITALSIISWLFGMTFFGICAATDPDFSQIKSWKGLGVLLSVLLIVASGIAKAFVQNDSRDGDAARGATVPPKGLNQGFTAAYIVGMCALAFVLPLAAKNNTARSYFTSPLFAFSMLGMLMVLFAEFCSLPLVDRKWGITDGFGMPTLTGGWTILALCTALSFGSSSSRTYRVI